MAKAKNLEAWGRAKAKERYAEGGGTDIPDMEASDTEDAPADRPAEIDDFIREVMRDQVKKMRE